MKNKVKVINEKNTKKMIEELENGSLAPLLFLLRNHYPAPPLLSFPFSEPTLVQFTEKAVPVLVKATESKNNAVVDFAILALGLTKDPRALNRLIELLEQPDAGIRTSSARALGVIADPRAVEPLINHLKNETNPYVRYDMALALSNINAPEALAALKEAHLNETVNWLKDAIKGMIKELEKEKNKKA